MASTTIIGYILAGLGLVGIVASSAKIKATIPLISSIPTNFMVIGSGILVAAGVILLISSSKSGRIKQVEEEVPIYEGEGRKRKIVGYQRTK